MSVTVTARNAVMVLVSGAPGLADGGEAALVLSEDGDLAEIAYKITSPSDNATSQHVDIAEMGGWIIMEARNGELSAGVRVLNLEKDRGHG